MIRYILLPFLLLGCALFIASCSSMPKITVDAKVDCPQPTAEALSRPETLPQVPALSSDPSETIRILSEVVASDVKPFQDEVDKRQVLIDHGVKFCGWTK